jgi:hypothetical protein
MSKRTNRKAATGANGAAKKTNTPKPTACPCAKQLHFEGFTPPPEPGEGPVETYLLARPYWVPRTTPAVALGLTEREVRDQSEHSGGLVIFGSGQGQGLKHSDHADNWELRACEAELEKRAFSLLRRRDDIAAIRKQREAGR